LDNVAEVLHVLTDAQKSNAVAKRLMRRAAEQEPKLRAMMSEVGWQRWGGTWINAKQLDEIRKDRAAIEAQLDKMQEDFDDADPRIRRIDDEIDENARLMRRMEANRYVQGNDGRTYRTALPSVYHDLKRDNEKLELRRRQLIGELQAIREAAKVAKSKLEAEGTFSGVHQIIGAEGIPVLAKRDDAEPGITPSGEMPMPRDESSQVRPVEPIHRDETLPARPDAQPSEPPLGEGIERPATAPAPTEPKLPDLPTTAPEVTEPPTTSPSPSPMVAEHFGC